jgi:hypothetical protein
VLIAETQNSARYDAGMRALDSKLFVLSAEIDRDLDDYRVSVPAIRNAESIAFCKPAAGLSCGTPRSISRGGPHRTALLR